MILNPDCPVAPCYDTTGCSYNDFFDIEGVRPLAQQVLSKVPRGGSVIKALSDYVQERCVYEYDHVQFGVTDMWLKPLQLLDVGRGDCEELSFLTASLLLAVGFRARVVLGDTPFGYHAWVEVRCASTGLWYLIECTSGQIYHREAKSRLGYIDRFIIEPDGCSLVRY